MQVEPISGEPTRFYVTSDSRLQCQCGHSVTWPREHKQQRPLEQCLCPRCAAPLELVRYLVDVAAWMGNGECACQDFQFRCKPEVSRGWNQSPLECRHLPFAFEAYGRLKAAEVGEPPQPT